MKQKVNIDLCGEIIHTFKVIEKFSDDRWTCECLSCGKRVNHINEYLINKSIGNCRCVKDTERRRKFIGLKFNRLLVIGEAPDFVHSSGKKRTMYKCQCDCGNIINVKRLSLQNGNTKSCGCWHKESSSINVKKCSAFLIKYEPYIFSAREVWQSTYKDGLSFEDFYQLSQNACFYCDSLPFTTTNAFLKKSRKNCYLKDLSLGDFTYNGLDRIDSQSNHKISNIVTCCILCNRVKRERSLKDFHNYISSLCKHTIIEPVDHRKLGENLKLDNWQCNSYKVSVKCTYSHIYSDGNLRVEDFYKLSLLNCYYCGAAPSNKASKYKDNIYYIYNGLDRLDSSIKHDYDNVVACCKFCNFGKGKLSLELFTNWINKIKANFNLFNKQYINKGI